MRLLVQQVFKLKMRFDCVQLVAQFFWISGKQQQFWKSPSRTPVNSRHWWFKKR